MSTVFLLIINVLVAALFALATLLKLGEGDIVGHRAVVVGVTLFLDKDPVLHPEPHDAGSKHLALAAHLLAVFALAEIHESLLVLLKPT
jgi:hypothetical protein